MSDPVITPELVKTHGLTPEEYEKIQGILGRVPSYTELGIFSVMWSEHCSYKSTRPLLKKFPTRSPKILVGAGEENAGIIDIGDGLAIAFKMESHNHPSAVEPFRAPNMTPYEIMLSESQERMLIIVKRGHEAEVQRVFDKWDLPWSEIGIVTDTGHMVVRHHGQVVADIPARKIADDSPVYNRPQSQPAYLKKVRAFDRQEIGDLIDPVPALRALMACPTIASKNWVYRQYDHMVRNGTAVCPGSDAAVLRIKADSLPLGGHANTADRPATQEFGEKYLALTVDGNAAYVYLDPYEGSKIAVAEAARNLACSGAVPLGVTDNLNFGSPLNPEIMFQLAQSIEGLAEACRVLDTPVTGGNVSLYNQNPEGAIDPTPTVGMVGLIEKAEHITTQWFKDAGDEILLLGEAVDGRDPLLGLGGSAYLRRIHNRKTGTPPRCDLAREKTLQEALRSLIRSGVIKSAHDCSEGGLAVCLAESCISRTDARQTPRLIGATVDLSALVSPRLDVLLFGETQARVVISVASGQSDAVLNRLTSFNIPACILGQVGGDSLVMKRQDQSWAWPVSELRDAWWNSIAQAMK
jgi:phosphoribosylformylglycinamidine synthase subunit PurL